MKITVDTEGGIVSVTEQGETREYPLSTPEAFERISKAWLRAGWDTKHVYTFSWLGRPIIQLPEDMIRLQEVIFHLAPDVIVETGIAHGGSLIFYASLLRLMGKGRVIGVDVEIRPHNRKAIEAHPLANLITMIEGSSVEPSVLTQVKKGIAPAESVLVLLDSNHTRDHVLAELEAYGPLVSVGSYVVAMDGIMEEVAGAPRTQRDWTWNNPRQAVKLFLEKHPEFVLEEPKFRFSESPLTKWVTYWPGAFLKRLR